MEKNINSKIVKVATTVVRIIANSEKTLVSNSLFLVTILGIGAACGMRAATYGLGISPLRFFWSFGIIIALSFCAVRYYDGSVVSGAGQNIRKNSEYAEFLDRGFHYPQGTIVLPSFALTSVTVLIGMFFQSIIGYGIYEKIDAFYMTLEQRDAYMLPAYVRARADMDMLKFHIVYIAAYLTCGFIAARLSQITAATIKLQQRPKATVVEIAHFLFDINCIEQDYLEDAPIQRDDFDYAGPIITSQLREASEILDATTGRDAERRAAATVIARIMSGLPTTKADEELARRYGFKKPPTDEEAQEAREAFVISGKNTEHNIIAK